MGKDPRDQEIGARIRDLRLKRGWPQRELAARLSVAGPAVSRSMVVQMELGERRCPLSRAYRIAALFGVPPQAIIGDDMLSEVQLRVLHLLDQVPEEKREGLVELIEHMASFYCAGSRPPADE